MSLASWPVWTLAVALVALAVEAAVGWPAPLYAAIGHPVTWIGALISRLDRMLNRESASFATRRAGGIVALVVVLGVVGGIGVAVSASIAALLPLPLALLATALLAAALPAQRSLATHVEAVADGLDGSLEEGRRAVSMIVGRDTSVLDEAGISRAAIESLAENFSDGIVAPVFWTAVAGLPGGLLYKAANTADSMIGHRSPRHLAFGWAAARFDDLINLPASRLSALWLIAAAASLPDASPWAAIRAIRRDAKAHTSPNAGWPEAAMAGALGFALAGPRVYHGETLDAAFMGDGRRDLTAADIRRALGLYRRALVIEAALLTALLTLFALA